MIVELQIGQRQLELTVPDNCSWVNYWGGGEFEATVQSTECVESLLLNYFFQLMSIPLADAKGHYGHVIPLVQFHAVFGGIKLQK